MFSFDCDGICGAVTNILLIIAAVLIIHYFYLISNFNFWKNRGVFSPNPTALFGDLPGQVNGKRHLIYDLDDLYKKYKSQHSYIGIFNFRSPRLLVFDPEIAKDILVKYFKNFQATELYNRVDRDADPLFGNHMFVLIGEEWKSKRQEVSPALTNSRIKAIHPIFEDVYDKMDKFIRMEISKSDFDGFEAKDLSARFTISIVSNSIYNIDPRTFEGGESEILKLANKFLTPSKRFMILQILWSLYPILSEYFKLSFAQKDASQFFYGLMANSMKQREESGIKRIDYLEYLIGLKNRKEIDEKSIAAHGATFLVDGYDTSSGAIASALYELAKNKDVQKKLRDEIHSKMPTDAEFTYDNIMSLDYLDQVWNETLRIHNPGSHFGRVCTEPITLDMPKDKKISFNVGDMIYIPLQSIFKDPEYYENPEKFDPDRFAPEIGGVKSFIERGLFFPFGIGPRACIGSRFAIAQAKYCIAALVKNFDISLNAKTIQDKEIHPQSIIIFVSNCYLDFKTIKKE